MESTRLVIVFLVIFFLNDLKFVYSANLFDLNVFGQIIMLMIIHKAFDKGNNFLLCISSLIPHDYPILITKVGR